MKTKRFSKNGISYSTRKCFGGISRQSSVGVYIKGREFIFNV